MEREIKIKLLAHAPDDQLKKKNKTDAGFDVRCAKDTIIKPVNCLNKNFEYVTFFDGSKWKRTIYEKQLIPTGVQLEAVDLSFFFLVPRSGFSSKYLLFFRNSMGLIDFEYRGELLISAYSLFEEIPILRGERIAQLVPVNQQETKIRFVKVLQKTERGEDGFGSTGTL